MIPFEGLIPYAIMLVGFAGAGAVMNGGITTDLSSRKATQLRTSDSSNEEPEVKHYIKNRYSIDQWDKYFAVRDLRLTGSFRGQSDDVKADELFKTNSIAPFSNTWKPWVLRKHIIMKNTPTKMMSKFNPSKDVYYQDLKETYIREMGGDIK